MACAAALLLMAAMLLPAPLAAQTRSQIFGTILTTTPEGEKLALPGALIVLKSKTDPAGIFATETDETGTYSLMDVPGGIYTFTVTLDGYAKHSEDVGVEPGVVRDLSATLKLARRSERVIVTTGATTIETQESTQAAEISGEIYQTAALASERFLDALPLIPGVVRGSDGLMNIKGATSSQSGWLVNSANVTDPATGEQAISLPVDVIQNVEVLSNPYSAEYGKFAGAVTSVETKDSSSEWSVRLNNLLPRFRRRAGHIRGVEAATPRITFAGPLVKGKLFLRQSFEYRLIRTPVTSLPELERDSDLESFDSFSQFDIVYSALHKTTVVASIYPQKNRFASLDTFNPQPTTANRKQRGWMLGFRDRKIFKSGALLETTLSGKDFDVDVLPASADPAYILRPDVRDGAYFNTQSRASRRYEWLEMYSFAPMKWSGQHWLKTGVNIALDEFRGRFVNRPVEVRRADTTLSELITFSGAGVVARDKTETSFFLQDKWNVSKRVTVDLGLRYDRDTVIDRNNLSPRAGFALVLTSDNKTVLRGGAGYFFDKIPLNVAVFEQLQQRTVTRFAADGITPLGPALLFENRLFNLRNPRSLAFSLELDRELRPGLLLRIGGVQRDTRHDYKIDIFENPLGVSTIEVAARGRNRYREFQLTANYSFKDSNFLNVSYVFSRADGDLNKFQEYFGTLQNPIIRPNERGRLATDAPHRIVAWGTFELPYKLVFSPTLEVRSGFPFSHLDEEQNFVGLRNEAGRFPVNATLDTMLSRRITVEAFGAPRTALVGVRFFNVLDRVNPRDVQQNIDALNAGQFFNSRGFLIRGKFTLEF